MRRGDKGVELLVKMPQELFLAIKARQRRGRPREHPGRAEAAAVADAAARGADASAIVGDIRGGGVETLTAENT